MSKNPILNALSASTYIVLIASFMFWGVQFAPKQDTWLAPVAMISLFTLSAAVMGYLFCYTPLALFLEGKKKAAANLFLQTVGTFGILTFLTLFLVFFQSN